VALLRQSLLAIAAVVPAMAGGNQGTPDIFANFHIRESVTGNNYYFRILLDRPCAPTAVANFLGLVTGARAWVDPATGLPSTEPFYEGTRIYKVVPGSPAGEVCFGSPANDGTGGPGYVFQDISLVPPGDGNDAMWQVYMDNNGPNTNGSRFFISGVSQDLNDRYTRLGVVQQWTNTIPRLNSYLAINALSNAARDEDGKPRNDLTIESITIDGWDEDDPTFLIDVWDLPVVGTAEFQITRQGGLWKLFGFAEPGAVITYQASADLVHWSPFQTHVDLPGSSGFGADISEQIHLNPRGFYRGASVRYPVWPATGLDLEDAILQFDYIDDLGDSNPGNDQLVRLILDFSSIGSGGTWIRRVNGFFNDSGDFSAVYSAEDPFRGELIVTRLSGTNLSDFTFRLHFEHHFPVDAVIDRFEAFTITFPPEVPESHEGQWTYQYFPN